MSRLSKGCGDWVDRAQPLTFFFNGRRYRGLVGDTLASALLANDVRIVSRSFKRHRPRGILSAGLEEPNALVTVTRGVHREVNVRATEVQVYEGMVVTSQNCWPHVQWDVGRVLDVFARLIPAGFYHKTFKWPGWKTYEAAVRQLAGLGRAGLQADVNRYATCFHHCDVLVVGGGWAGMEAALQAAAEGHQVLLVEQRAVLGGSGDGPTDSSYQHEHRRIEEAVRRVEASSHILVLRRTLAFGLYEGNLVAAVQQLDDVTSSRAPGAEGINSRLWKIRARRVTVAAGAIERPLVFANNDRPGIMLASAVRTYLRRYAVCAGSRIVVFTNNDSAYQTAFALHDAGATIVAIVDVRAEPPVGLLTRARSAGMDVHFGSAVVDTRGRSALRAVDIAKLANGCTAVEADTHITLNCDLLCVSGGWNPTLHLYSQVGRRLHFDVANACFVPEERTDEISCVGAAAGAWNAPEAGLQPLWCVPSLGRKDQRHVKFVDFAHDVTVADIELAVTEGFDSVEHLKRYTTTGMAFDQGKTSNVNALAILAQATDRPIEGVGTTTFRPPFNSVTIGAFGAGRSEDLAHRFRALPVRTHEEQGAVLEDHSGWLRPAYYQRRGETERQSIDREVRAARAGVVLMDTSSLGKIEVGGRDAAEFLNRLYVNDIGTLEPGRLRYGLMLNDSGVIIDDGVVGCLSPEHYLVNTSSAGALNIHFWMEEWLQCEWKHLRVWIAQQTAQWATLTVSGPQARSVLSKLNLEINLNADAFGHMQCRHASFRGRGIRVRRASFTGELSFELDVPADRGDELWGELMNAGGDIGITPLGMEALDILRVEKGFLEVGVDTDGDTSPLDVGWGAAVARKRDDFLGKRSLLLEAMQSKDRLQLVGLEPTDHTLQVPVGTMAVTERGEVQGHVTSSCDSPHLGRVVALGLIRSGLERKGSDVLLRIGGRDHAATIVDKSFFDPRGERLHA